MTAQRAESQGLSKLDYAEIQRTKTQSQKSATGIAKNSRAKGGKTSDRIKGATEERSGFETLQVRRAGGWVHRALVVVFDLTVHRPH